MATFFHHLKSVLADADGKESCFPPGSLDWLTLERGFKLPLPPGFSLEALLQNWSLGARRRSRHLTS